MILICLYAKTNPCFVGGDDDVILGYYLAESIVGELEEGAARTEKVDELLGLGSAAVRPESASDASCHNDAVIMIVVHSGVF